LLDFGDIEGMVDKIGLLLKDKTICDKIVNNNLCDIKNYGLGKVTEDYLKEYGT